MNAPERLPPPPARPPWTIADVLLAIVAGTVAGIALSGFTGALVLRGTGVSRSIFFLVVASFVYGGVVLMAWLLIFRRRGVGPSTAGFRKVGVGPILLMIPLTLGVLFMNLIVATLTAALFGDVPTAEDQLGVSGTTITLVDFIALMIVGAVFAPVVEELVFRGLLYRVLRARSGVGVASVITALAFALVHFTPLLIGVFFVFGLILAVVAEHFDSLYPPIVLHALNNSVALGLVYAAQ